MATDVGSWILRASDPDPRARRAVAGDPAAPAEVLARLARDDDAGVRLQIGRNDAAPATLRAEVLASLAAHKDPNVRWGVARNRATPGAALARMAADANPNVREGVANNPATPPEVLARLARDAVLAVRAGVGANGATAADVLARLAADPHPAIRVGVAQQGGAPAELLEALARDDDARLRWGVARNPAAPAAVLARLATDPDALVRREVAHNRATPAAVLADLAADADSAVRAAVARNPTLTPDTLSRLVHHPNAQVRAALAGYQTMPPGALASLAADDDAQVRLAVARNAASPADVLARLSADADPTVRLAVARNAAASADVVTRLTADADPTVRAGAAARASAEALAGLSTDVDRAVRLAVVRNAAASAEVLARLAADADPGVRAGAAAHASASADVLARLSADPDPTVRRAVARHTAAPTDVLTHLAADADLDVRVGVARNAAAAADVRARLAEDPEVRRATAVALRVDRYYSRDFDPASAEAVGAAVGWDDLDVPNPGSAAAPAPGAPRTEPHRHGGTSPVDGRGEAILEGAPAAVRDAYRHRRDQPSDASTGSTLGTRPPFTTYRVWFATNRRPAHASGAARDTVHFSGHSADTTSYGWCDVDIPLDRALGSLGSPWWRRLARRVDDRLSVGRVGGLDEDGYWAALTALLNALPRVRARATVFLHGYNVGFTAAALRAAQLGHDLRVPGPMCFFSWPSRGGLLGYLADAAAVEASEPAITRYLVRLAADTGAERVDVIAHSMGNRGLLRALDRITANAAVAARCRFGHFVLAAPDVDRRTFLNLAAAYRCAQSRTTLYVSARDRALGVSAWLHAFGRVGFAPPVTVADGVDTVHVESADRTLLAHGYFGSVRTVLTDMHDVLEFDAPPERRSGLLPASTTDGRPFWRIAR